MSPREGPVQGGTRLTIRGSNLGRNKDDVVGLLVCGSNVLSSLEYVSASKLVCVTKCYKVCSGSVTVETQSGGRGVSLVQFSFIDTSSSSSTAAVRQVSAVSVVGVSGATDTYSDSTSECSSSLSRSSSRGDADIKRQPSVKVFFTVHPVLC